MIAILHNKNRVIGVFDYDLNEEIEIEKDSLVAIFFSLAERFENRIIIWCNYLLRDKINFDEIGKLFNHKLIMASYNVGKSYYIDKRIGYVEASPYTIVNKEVKYPTWLMSSNIGAINSDVLLAYNINDYKNRSFEYVLNSIAKNGLAKGLFCYSSPSIIKKTDEISLNESKTSFYTLYVFIKEHYRLRWVFISFFNSLVYEKRFMLLPLLLSVLTSKKVRKPKFVYGIKESKSFNPDVSIDVIIPTIGRKTYLYDVLRDLSHQTIKPKNVIIIEQNPDKGTESELSYLYDESWPFKIKHEFIHKSGACNARNKALQQVKSDWVFLADDDIRFEENTIKLALQEMHIYHLNAATLQCLRKGDKKNKQPTLQWNTFGSGCSIISKKIAKSVKFDEAFEHGFGEDGDYGMQIRNLGEDIGYISMCTLLHLKAPVGGFRTKFVNSWANDKVQPKPSPTIMLYNIKHQSKYQIRGYKTILFFKFFKRQNNKNVFTYYFKLKKQWKKSIELAYRLKKQ
ncbi:glycosyltransferase family 2 protein [Seonamhaeicola sp. MEBiC1930]|uniref:glycosyltransferase family 2 protein n=1 Tax=Seonamhaeicola sp. MEBiC01930 TaxID=2976768 RepID=UPI0032449592